MLSLQSTCLGCGQHFPTTQLAQCSRCKVAYYCCAQHQEDDYPTHRSLCHAVNSTRQDLAVAETQLRDIAPENIFTNTDISSEDVREADVYLRYRRPYVRSLAAIGSSTAVALALEEALDSIRLNHSDVLGDGVPALMLLLGKWQEAYNFLKWRLTFDDDGIDEDDTMDDYDRSSVPSFPAADITEPIGAFEESYCIFTFAALTRIKLEMATRVQAVIDAYAVADHTSLPAPATSDLRALLWASSQDGQPRTLDGWKQLHTTLMLQGKAAFKETLDRNREFWKTMLNPQDFKCGLQYGGLMDYNGIIKPWLWPNALLWRDSKGFLERELQALASSEQGERAF